MNKHHRNHSHLHILLLEIKTFLVKDELKKLKTSVSIRKLCEYIKKYITIEATQYFIFLIKISYFAKFFFSNKVTKAAKLAKSRRRDDVSLEEINLL